VVDFRDEPFGAQLREIVAERRQSILIDRRVKRSGGGRMEVLGREGIASGNVVEPDESVHECELPRVIEFEPRHAFAIGEVGRFGEMAQLAAIDERFENVLLDGEVAVGDGGHGRAQLRQGVDGFRDGEIGHVVGGRFGAEAEVVADVLFDGAVAAVAADDRIREVEIFDDRFELAPVPFGDAAPVDDGELRRLADGAVRIEQAVAEGIRGGAAMKDGVVAVMCPPRICGRSWVERPLSYENP
jgi:hypothetical protein